MLITLTTPTYDLDGYAEIDALPGSTDLGEVRRRLSRVATLDGGAVFNDGGSSEADRSISLRWTPADAATEATIARMVRLYQRLRISCTEGVFDAAPESYKSTQNVSSLTLLVAEKLNT